MSAAMSLSVVPVPVQMQALPRDKRGYPVPYIVQYDREGKPLFAVNDASKRQQVLHGDRCGICGGKLTRARWLVGGPAAAFHAHGAYIDPPMHGECVHYALQVCPYLAAPSYGKEVGPVQAARAKISVVEDPQVTKERPPLFVAVQYVGQSFVMEDMFGIPLIKYVKPKRPYRRVEYWLQRQLLDPQVGERMAAEHVEDLSARLPQP